MAGSLVKDDPEQEGTIALWQDMRAFLDERYPDAVLISEWGEPDKTIRAGFHMDFLLQFGTSHYMDLFRCEHPGGSPARGRGTRASSWPPTDATTGSPTAAASCASRPGTMTWTGCARISTPRR